MLTTPEPGSEQVWVRNQAVRHQTNADHLCAALVAPSHKGVTAGAISDSAKGLQKATHA